MVLSSSKSETVFTVYELTSQMKAVVEELFAEVCVIGEISNLNQPQSGHCYLSLKDDLAQLSAVIWKTTASRLKFNLKNGLEVVCRGRIEIYPPHGKYQLIITSIEPNGVGTLELAFRQLYEKLKEEGLFLPERKKTLPVPIRRIGVVTSATGAAIRDFLSILGRRTQRVDVVVCPVKVQGDDAAKIIEEALTFLNRKQSALKLDAIALIRGGGSVEDLWTLNEEPVVRAVAASRIPVITGIGHEIDVSLSDLAADIHALTPSDAAVRLVSDDTPLYQKLIVLSDQLRQGVKRKIEFDRSLLSRLESMSVFQSPKKWLVDHRVNFLEDRLERMNQGMEKTLEKKRHLLAELMTGLESLSPLSVLQRGYSLTLNEQGRIVRQVSDVWPGMTITTQLSNGKIKSKVLNLTSDNADFSE